MRRISRERDNPLPTDFDSVRIRIDKHIVILILHLISDPAGRILIRSVETVFSKDRLHLRNGDIVPVVICQFTRFRIITVPAGTGRTDARPCAVDVHVIIHRQGNGSHLRGVNCLWRRHHVAHHRETILRVGKAGGVLIRVGCLHREQLRPFLGEMNGLAVDRFAGLHLLGIGDRHRYRGGRLDLLPVKLELYVKEAGKDDRFLRFCHFHGRNRLLVIMLIFLGICGDLRHEKRHALGQRRSTVAHLDRIIRPDKLQRSGLFLRYFAGLRMDMLRKAADDLPLAVLALRPVGMPLHATEEALLRQQSIAEDHGAFQLVSLIAHPVRGVAFDGLDLGRHALRRRDQLRHDAHMIRNAVLIVAEEDQVSHSGDIAFLRSVRIHETGGVIQVVRLLRERLDPAFAAGAHGEFLLRHARIMETEGDVDGAPVAVWRTIPRAVSRVAFLLRSVLFIDDEVFPTFSIAKLRLRNGQHILPPLAGQPRVGYGLFPHLRSLKIRRRIRIADRAVGMFFLCAEQNPSAVAKGAVLVPFALGKLARQSFGINRFLNSREAVRIVDMLKHLSLSTDQGTMVKAFFRMFVEDYLFSPADRLRLGGSFSIRRLGSLPAGQRFFPGIAAVCMLVPLRFRKGAGQLPHRRVAAFPMLMRVAFRDRTY